MKTFFIAGRQTGKSHMAVYEFLKDPSHSIFIGINTQQIDQLMRKHIFLNVYREKCFTQNTESLTIQNFIREQETTYGIKVSTIVIDEYLCYSDANQRKFHTLFENFAGNIHIFSTPKKQYDKVTFRDVINHKYRLKSDTGMGTWGFYNTKEFDELFHNFITDIDFSIIHDENHRYFVNKDMIENKERFGYSDNETYGTFLKDQDKPKFECPYLKSINAVATLDNHKCPLS